MSRASGCQAGRCTLHAARPGSSHKHSSRHARAAAGHHSHEATSDANATGQAIETRSQSRAATGRRRLISLAIAVPALSAVGSHPGSPAQAATLPFNVPLPWSGFFFTSPEPVRVPRKSLNLNFAILLMRSTYEAVDALDMIAMDKFQIKFWKLRQNEFEPYKALVDPAPVPVGDLRSPLYFDFIAFSQYAALSNAIPDAPQVFEEYCEECEGDPFERPNRIVRRDASLSDNKKLPQRLQLEVGRTIYQKLREGFRGQDFDCPAPLSPQASADEVAAAARSLLKLFSDNGYAIKLTLTDVEPYKGGDMSWNVRVEGGANLWGLQALRARQALVTDAFEAFALQGLLDASGFDATFKVDVNSASYTDQTWEVKRRVLNA